MEESGNRFFMARSHVASKPMGDIFFKRHAD
jgi:hypothetical protein